MGLTWACGGGRRRRGAGEGRRLRRRQITALALGELAAEHPAHRGQQPEEDPSAAHTIEVAAEAGHIPLPPERVEKRASSTHQTPPSTQKFEETVRPQRALETLNSAPCAATPREVAVTVVARGWPLPMTGRHTLKNRRDGKFSNWNLIFGTGVGVLKVSASSVIVAQIYSLADHGPVICFVPRYQLLFGSMGASRRPKSRIWPSARCGCSIAFTSPPRFIDCLALTTASPKVSPNKALNTAEALSLVTDYCRRLDPVTDTVATFSALPQKQFLF
ncbi:hypothetical protein GEV33_002213 [Tenebrio molitor]|uniref:Uncharacterized protein n=1 Tax=Tenebrio molitor TaxID=7067 RepID=A0A8J6HW16_TENMO|nr:hypothetical protein GEV33_002213 [Tenebrio molitor]